jgi:hypothetical protein
MTDLNKWEDKIKEKRKQTDFREFVKDICSWYNLVLYKNNWQISSMPQNERNNIIVNNDFFFRKIDNSNINIEASGNNFFDNFKKVFVNSYMPATTRTKNSENSEYSDTVVDVKDTYLSFCIVYDCNNIFYSFNVKEWCSNILNSNMVRYNCDSIYNSSWIMNSFNVFYSKFIYNSSNIWFSDNLIWCKECISCNWLENKSYYINNKEYTKEDYKRKKDEILKNKTKYIVNDYSTWINIASKNTKNCSFVIKSENIENWRMAYNVKDWRNIFLVGWTNSDERIYDCAIAWSPMSTDFYWVISAGRSSNVYNSVAINWWSKIYYCFFCIDCSYCLWCVWLQNKSFCILNKQYTREERFELANKIFAQMEKDWTLWQFFPWSMNPFYFNDTIAYLIDDTFTKEEVEAEWYLRRDEEIKVDIPIWAELITTTELDQYQWFDADWNRKINPEILKKVIQDKKWNYYRIMPMELEFLQKHGLPLPEIHWLERIKLGFKFK